MLTKITSKTAPAIAGLQNAARRIMLILAAIVTLVIVLLAFAALLRYGLIYWIYALVNDWSAARLGFDYYLATLTASVFAASCALLVPTLCWAAAFGKRRFAAGLFAAAGVQFMVCLAVYTVGRDVCFDRRTGAPICYYADTAQGRAWSYSPGFDPVSGKPFEIYTRAVREADEARIRKRQAADDQTAKRKDAEASRRTN